MISNIDYNKKISDITINKPNIDIYISLTTIPPRFLSDEFELLLINLINQSIKPTKIFVSLPIKYMRNFLYDRNKVEEKIKYITKKYNLIEFLRPKDYGPATKLLGLIELKKLNDDDIIIVLDDDIHYSNNLVMTYMNAFTLYDADICAVDQTMMIKKWNPYRINLFNEIYYNNYNDKLYGWLSFCIKYSKLNNMMKFYDEICIKFPDIIFHDDLIFTIYYKLNNLCAVGTTIPTFKYNMDRSRNDNNNALRNNILSNQHIRTHLETIVFEFFKLNNKMNPESVVKNDIIYVTKNIIIYVAKSNENNIIINNKEYTINDINKFSSYVLKL